MFNTLDRIGHPMAHWNIVVIVLHERLETLAEQVRIRMAKAWTGPQPATFKTARPSDIRDEPYTSFDAAIFVEDIESNLSSALSLLTLFEEHSVPMIVLTEKPIEKNNAYEFSGALVKQLDCDDSLLCAMLAGILHRQQEVRRLKQEISLAHRFQGGMRTEITKIHEELQLAAMVQREFLPKKIPSLCGVNFATLWRPAHYVAGDIYDISRLDEDHIGVFLADAAGHGVPAALMTMVICRALETKDISGSTYRILPPHEVMARLNEGMIRRQGQSSRFATAVYALINCRTRTMSISGAGHPPPKLIHADGTTTEIETPGGLLGVFEDETFDQVDITLCIDDRMLLFTDGFEQAFPEASYDSHEHNYKLPTDRYHEEFEVIAALMDPNKMIAAIDRRLDDQSGSLHQIDDLTLICMHAGSLDDQPDQEYVESSQEATIQSP